MNTKKLIIIVCLLCMIFATISAVSSEEITDDNINETVNHTHTSISEVISKDVNDPPGTFTELNTLIQSASDGQTIYLYKDYAYVDSDSAYILGIDIHKNIIIDGQGHTINGSDKARIFAVGTLNNAHSTVDDVTLRNINFANARNTNINSTTYGNTAKNYAFGALEFYGNGNIINCNFTNNYAFCAAAIAIGYGNFINVTGCNFINNTGFGQGGGAIRLRTQVNGLTISNSLFENNYGDTYGGAVHSDMGYENDACTVINTTFINNSARLGGGGLFFETPNANLINSTFISNNAPLGGGVYWNGYSGDVSNSIFIGNNATTGGGVFCSGRSTTHITTSEFINNTATNGGGIYFDQSEGAAIYDCSFDGNIVIEDGGAIYCEGKFFVLNNSNFTNDIAHRDGGSTYFDVGAYVNNCAFDNEHADRNGGGMYVYAKIKGEIPAGVELGVFYSNFTKCSAGNNGGAGYVFTDYGVVKNSILINCTAANVGGGGFISGSYGKLINSKLIDNTASNGGGVYWEGNNGTLVNSELSGNKALNGNGGGLYWVGNNGNLTDSNFSKNHVIVTGSNTDTSIGNGGSIIWLGSNGTITNSNFNLSSAKNSGGAIYLTGNNTHIITSNFQRVNATSGAGIYVDGNDVNITESNFEYGEADFGGIIFINGNNTVVTNSNLTYCFARVDGGAFFVEGDNAKIIDSNLKYSYAEHSGGAIYINGEHTVFSNSNLTYNNATFNGGSIYINGSDTNITNSSFNFCIANSGGAIYIEGSDAKVISSIFTQNMAEFEFFAPNNDGGSIYIAGDNALILESNFTNNTAGYGGSIYVTGNNTNITKAHFQFISATDDGGAIYVGGINTTIAESIFNYNNGTRGGSVYIDGNNTEITDSLFQYVFASEGGAIYIEGFDAHILKSNFTENGQDTSNIRDGTRGGSIFVAGDNALITESNFLKTDAANGGAIYITGDGTNVTNSNFKLGLAKYNGGSIYVGGVNTSITGSTFNLTNATNGGAIYVNGTNSNIESNFTYCFVKNGNGGAIYVEGDNNNITNSNFSYTINLGGNGGAIYVGGDNLTISNSISKFSSAVRTNAENASKGGAVYVSGDGVKVIESQFESFNATDAGGGFYVEGNNLNITNSSFSRGVSKYGGSIYIEGNDTYVENSNFTYCHALIDGGGFYVDGDNTVITDSNIMYSFAEQSGGGLFIDGSNNLISDSNFALNNASGAYGGSIYINGDNNNITNSSFERCTSTKGGAVYINGKKANILDSTFAQNGVNPASPTDLDTAGGTIYIAGDDAFISGGDFKRSNARNGGMIYIEGYNANINSSNFTQSSANYNGGAIYVAGENATIYDSTFSLHNATNGSAIYINGYDANIIKSNFTETVAVGGDGGAIYVGGNEADIIDSTFNSIRVINGNGGAIYVAGNNSNISNSNFNMGNAINAGYRGGNGGMIYISGENVTVLDSNFSKSNSTLSGGALYVAGNDAFINNSYFEYSESERGGAVYIRGINATLSNSNITYSYARRNGGAIYVNGEKSNILNSKLDFSHAERSGGAIFVNGTNTTISNSYLLHNYVVNLNGGSVYVNGNDTHINGSVFQFGTANEGGSVYINGDNTSINGSVFQFGTAKDGGAIFVAGEKTFISNSSFLQNNVSTSTGNGGTIYIAGNETHVDTSNFERSNANYGGIIYIVGDNANVSSSNFTKSYSYTSGGAIYVNGKNTTIDGSKFSLHNATDGGAIYVKGENTVILDSDFNKSVAYNDGGAIYLGGNNTKIYNSTFDENIASHYGGAIANKGGTASLISSNFTNNIVNSTQSRGGAIYWKGESSNDIVLDCYFENNSALDTNHAKGALGGAIYWERGSTPTTNSSIINSTFVNNTSEHHGGAIDWFNANNGTIENCVFIENYAKHDGGALYIGDDGSNGENLTINNSVFIKNHAGVKGGALSMQFYNSLVIDCNFTDNYASGAGSVYMNNVKANHTQYIKCNFIGSYSTSDHGGVAIINVPYIDFINCTFVNATVPSGMQGAGIYFNNKATYSRVIDSNFTNCSNARMGGAISIPSAKNINISGSNFNLNNATEDGGAIYIGGTNTTIEKSTFNNNSASDGGALYIISQENLITDLIFNYNKAKQNGGSIYLSRSDNQYLNNLTVANSTAIKGGGLYFDRASGIPLINSLITSNLAEEGAGMYFDSVYDNNIVNTTITNNNATKGSGIYTFDSDYSLYNVIILDNQAHANEFINEAINMTENGTYYVTATFLGYDNRLNGIWDEMSEPFIYSNVTYWGANGTTVTDTIPDISDREMGQNVTITRYSSGSPVSTEVVVTNETGDFTYEFEDDGSNLVEFSFKHSTDNYYTEITKDVTIKTTRVTIKIEDINLGENATVNVTLTDADGNPLSGTVRVIINDSNKNFTITVTDGKGSATGISEIPAGTHNATVTYEGNTEYLGSTNSTTFNVKTALDLTINKTVDKTIVNVSDIVEFTITVTNKGPSNATGVNVTDELNNKLEYINSTPSQGTYNPTTHIWTIGNITSGLTVTLKIRAKVLTNGTIPNTANVTSIENDTNTSNNNDSSDNITANPKVNLTIIKTANITNTTVGDTVKFTITVYNNGPSNATNVIITDTLDTGFTYITANGTPTGDRTITWNIGNLENGTNATVWLIVKILTNGTFTNIASVNSTEDPTGNKSNETNITVTPHVNLTIIKESNTTNVSVGDIIRFNLTIFNNGLSNATNVQVSDNLSSGFEFTNANGTYNKTGQNILWTIPLIENGTNTTVWVDVKVLTNGTFTNIALVNSTEDPTGNKSNETNITVNPKVNLTIIKTVNVTNATVGDTVKFTITVHNNGPSNATNIEITDTLNDAFEWVSDSGATRTTNTFKWTITSLANGTNTSVWITVKVLTNGTYSNIAKVKCSENTTETPSNETNVTVTPNVNLTIIKTANVTNVTVGDVVNFTITVYNTGLSNATNVKIVDVLDNAFNYIEGNGTPQVDTQTLTWTINNLENGTNATFWISVKVLTNGTFSNIATVNSTENPKGNTSNVTNITATPDVRFLIIKTVNATNVTAGDIVNFTITIYNVGLSNATRVQLLDVLNPAFIFIDSLGAVRINNTLKWGSGSEYLRPGENVSVWFTAQVILSGTFPNVARGLSAENPTGNTSNEVNVTAKPYVNLSITKNVDIASVSVGDIVNYTLTIYNNGLSNATNVEVFDELAEGLDFVESNIDPIKINGKNITWIIPNLENKTNTIIWLTVKVMVNGTFTNFATVNSTENTTPNKSNEINITVGPYVNLTVVKTANVTGNVSVGDIVNFTITVYNTGLSNASNVEIIDDLDPAFKHINDSGATENNQRYVWSIGNLENGTNHTVWITVQVTSNGTFSNFAIANSTEIPRGNTSNITNITATPKVNLTVTKTVNATNVSVGDIVRFTIQVRNNGPSNATNIEITDVLNKSFEFINSWGNIQPDTNGKIIWTINNMSNGTISTVWVDVKVLNNGTFSNIATANCSENKTEIPSNETNVTVIPNVNLTITKIGNTSVAKVNDLVNFTITVYNTGLSNATEVNVTDLLPNELAYVSSGSNISDITGVNSTFINGTKIVTWTIPILTNGSSVKLWVVVNITNNGTFTNVAIANSKENTTNKTNETNITVKPAVDLVINKTVDKTLVNVSDIVEFTITVTNNGPSNATDVNVTDVLDSHLKYKSSTASQGGYNEATHIWTIGNITSGLSVNLKIRAEVISNGTIPNFAFVTSNETDTNTSNNNGSSDNITAKPLVNLTVVKTANMTTGRVGDIVNFTITVHNYGPSNATGVQIKDVLNSVFEFVSANGSYNRSNQIITWNIGNLANGSEATVNVVVRVLNNGTFTNVAIVNSSEDPTGNKSNGTNVTVTPYVEFNIIKTANVTGNVSVGDIVNFTITVYNTGLSNATNVEIVDKLDSAFEFVDAMDNVPMASDRTITWNIGNLVSGANKTVWLTVKVLTNGTFTNVAVANSTENPTGNKSNETNVTVTPIVNLTIIKFSNLTEGHNASVGDFVKFTILVINNGPSNATNVLVTDDLCEAFDYESTNTTTSEISGRHIVWIIPHLENGTNASIELVVKTVKNGFYSNFAIVNSTESENKTSNETPVTILPAVNLTVVKTSNVTKAVLNETVNFTIVVTNNGPSTATGVNITDYLPSGLEYVESGSNITGVTGENSTLTNGTKVLWNLGVLNNGDKALVWVIARVLETGTLVNVAHVNSNENTTGISNETEINVSNTVDLSIRKIVSKTSVYVGESVVYTITVTNNGPSDATNVIVREMLTGDVEIIKVVASKGSYNKVTRIWTIDELMNGEVETLTLTVKALKAETIKNRVSVSSDENDTNSSNNNDSSPDVIVKYLNTPIKLETMNITYGDVETLTVTLPKEATGYVDITVNDTIYKNQVIVDGTVVLDIPDLAGGEYDVIVTYAGDGKYGGNDTSGMFIVAPLTPTINIEVVDILYGEIEVLNVTVNVPGTVNITVLNKTISYVPLNHSETSTDMSESTRVYTQKTVASIIRLPLTSYSVFAKGNGDVNILSLDDIEGSDVLLMSVLDYDGKATWNLINLPVGTYPVFAVYNGNENYTTVNASGEFEVNPLPSWVSGSADDIYVGEDAIIYIDVIPNATGNITINIENQTYTTKINNNTAQITIPNLKAGEKQVQITYNGDNIYQPSKNTTTFTVKKILPPITINTQDIYVGDNETITITLPTDATENITITINGQNYTSPLNNGQATFTIENLTKGTYKVDVTYTGDDKYLPTNTTATFNVQEKQTPQNHTKTHNIPQNIGLAQYPTGNPILILLIALLTIGITTKRKNKK